MSTVPALPLSVPHAEPAGCTFPPFMKLSLPPPTTPQLLASFLHSGMRLHKVCVCVFCVSLWLHPFPPNEPCVCATAGGATGVRCGF